MIDGFAAQPYPLECSADGGETWRLVIGWRENAAALVPVVADDDGGLVTVTGSAAPHFRPSVGPRPTAAVAPMRSSSSPSR